MEIKGNYLEAMILDELVEDRVPVTLYLTNGFQERGVIANYDLQVIILFCEGKQKIFYKHSISSITPMCMLEKAKPRKP